MWTDCLKEFGGGCRGVLSWFRSRSTKPQLCRKNSTSEWVVDVFSMRQTDAQRSAANALERCCGIHLASPSHQMMKSNQTMLATAVGVSDLA